MALLPEDRRNQGLLLGKPVRENIVLSALKRIVSARLRRSEGGAEAGRRRGGAAAASRPIRIEQPAGTLSGGNQQKVVLAKLLATEARILLFFDPTRGVDVGTKAEIFALMRDLAARGFAILFFSTDLAELANVADRTLVMSYGRIAADARAAKTMTEDAILQRHAVARGRRMNDRSSPCAPPRLAAAAARADAAGCRHRHHCGRARSRMDQINIKIAAAMTLILIATGQTIVVTARRDRPVGRRHPQPHHGDLRRRAAIPALSNRSCGSASCWPSARSIGVLNGLIISARKAAALRRDARDLVDPRRLRTDRPARGEQRRPPELGRYRACDAVRHRRADDAARCC